MPLENIESCLHCERSKRAEDARKWVQREVQATQKTASFKLQKHHSTPGKLSEHRPDPSCPGCRPGPHTSIWGGAADVGCFLVFVLFSGQYSSSMCKSIWVSFCPAKQRLHPECSHICNHEQLARLCWNLASEDGQLPHTLQVSKPPAGTCGSEKDSSNKRARHGSAFVCSWQNVFNQYLCYKLALKTIWFVAMILNKVSYVHGCLGRVQFSVCFVNYAA